MSDRLVDGRWCRVWPVVDPCTRECLLLLADRSVSGEQVAAALERVLSQRGGPRSSPGNYGSEFASRAMDAWAACHGIHLDVLRPGKPVEHGALERVTGRLRDECLNVQLFFSLDEAWEQLDAWRQDDHLARPHSALGDEAPAAFARAWLTSVPSDAGPPPSPKVPHESCSLLEVFR